jgi:hypothetical protein
MHLSPHFTLTELIKSQITIRRGIKNVPNAGQINNLKRVTKGILEPVREHFGRPFSPSSGFRSQALNVAIGSKSSSQHTRGEAVDFELPGISNRDVAEWIRDHLDFDQLILEFHDPEDPMSGWVHVSLKEKENRRQVLTINHKGVWAGLGE